MKRKHPNKSWRWKVRKYFLTTDGWQFHDTDKKGKTVRLFHAQTVIIKRHVKVKSNANPYDPAWEMYFERRQEQWMQTRIKPKLRLLYRRQQGKCPVCQTKITTETGRFAAAMAYTPPSGETSWGQMDTRQLDVVVP